MFPAHNDYLSDPLSLRERVKARGMTIGSPRLAAVFWNAPPRLRLLLLSISTRGIVLDPRERD
jgi:hypothetical protein